MAVVVVVPRCFYTCYDIPQTFPRNAICIIILVFRASPQHSIRTYLSLVAAFNTFIYIYIAFFGVWMFHLACSYQFTAIILLA